MARKQQEMNLLVHYPKTTLGWYEFFGRIAIFNELMEAKARGEMVNMDISIRQITRKSALEAYYRALENPPKEIQRRRSKRS